jgi:hypothetical protein
VNDNVIVVKLRVDPLITAWLEVSAADSKKLPAVLASQKLTCVMVSVEVIE